MQEETPRSTSPGSNERSKYEAHHPINYTLSKTCQVRIIGVKQGLLY